ncbi:hypothetical protein DIPPA_15288 [Diplonema papillatum]|nr:hypothetical protein DIPPA_15288 [Diplonema papillatum]
MGVLGAAAHPGQECGEACRARKEAAVKLLVCGLAVSSAVAGGLLHEADAAWLSPGVIGSCPAVVASVGALAWVLLSGDASEALVLLVLGTYVVGAVCADWTAFSRNGDRVWPLCLVVADATSYVSSASPLLRTGFVVLTGAWLIIVFVEIVTPFGLRDASQLSCDVPDTACQRSVLPALSNLAASFVVLLSSSGHRQTSELEVEQLPKETAAFESFQRVLLEAIRAMDFGAVESLVLANTPAKEQVNLPEPEEEPPTPHRAPPEPRYSSGDVPAKVELPGEWTGVLLRIVEVLRDLRPLLPYAIRHGSDAGEDWRSDGLQLRKHRPGSTETHSTLDRESSCTTGFESSARPLCPGYRTTSNNNCSGSLRSSSRSKLGGLPPKSVERDSSPSTRSPKGNANTNNSSGNNNGSSSNNNNNSSNCNINSDNNKNDKPRRDSRPIAYTVVLDDDLFPCDNSEWGPRTQTGGTHKQSVYSSEAAAPSADAEMKSPQGDDKNDAPGLPDRLRPYTDAAAAERDGNKKDAEPRGGCDGGKPADQGVKAAVNFAAGGLLSGRAGKGTDLPPLGDAASRGSVSPVSIGRVQAAGELPGSSPTQGGNDAVERRRLSRGRRAKSEGFAWGADDATVWRCKTSPASLREPDAGPTLTSIVARRQSAQPDAKDNKAGLLAEVQKQQQQLQPRGHAPLAHRDSNSQRPPRHDGAGGQSQGGQQDPQSDAPQLQLERQQQLQQRQLQRQQQQQLQLQQQFSLVQQSSNTCATLGSFRRPLEDDDGAPAPPPGPASENPLAAPVSPLTPAHGKTPTFVSSDLPPDDGGGRNKQPSIGQLPHMASIAALRGSFSEKRAAETDRDGNASESDAGSAPVAALVESLLLPSDGPSAAAHVSFKRGLPARAAAALPPPINAWRKRTVALAALNLRGTHARFRGSGDVSDIEFRQALLLDNAVAFCASISGAVESFVGDRVTASFNASRPCSAYKRGACDWACKMDDVCKKACVFVSCGVAAGEALCGYAGNKAVVRYQVVGRVHAYVHDVERVSKDWNIGVVTDMCVWNDVSVSHAGRPILERVRLPKRGSNQHVVLWELTGIKPAALDSEWMYSVDPAAPNNTPLAYELAIAFLDNKAERVEELSRLAELEIDDDDDAFFQYVLTTVQRCYKPPTITLPPVAPRNFPFPPRGDIGFKR